MSDIIKLIAAIVGSNAVFGFLQFIIQFLVTRNDMKQNVGKKLDDLNSKVDRNQAILARTHILRFADELRNGVHHSSEYFRQQLDDCDTYNRFCESHPDFKNSYTATADKYIKETYERLLKEGKL